MLRKRSSVAVSLVIVLLVMILAAVAIPILAEDVPTVYTGEITESSPIMSPESIYCMMERPYEFGGYITVGITGDYDYADFVYLETGEYDTFMLLYTAPIDPANPMVNLFASADDEATITLYEGVLYYMYVVPYCGKLYGSYGFTFVGPDIRVSSEMPPEFAAAGAPAARPGVQFTDDRINNNDPGSPVAAYGHDFEDGHGLVVYTPFHQLALAVTASQIAAVPECPAENTMIAENAEMNVRLYRLSSCEFQLMAPALDGVKTYVLIFDILYSHNGYTSYES